MLCAHSSDRDNCLRNHRENPGTWAKLRANLCQRTTGPSTHCGHGLIITLFLFEVMQQDGASELFLELTPPALREVPHWSWPSTAVRPAAATAVTRLPVPHHSLRCHLQPVSSTFPVHPTALTLLCLAEVLLSVLCYSESSSIKKLKTSSKMELTALPSLVLENVTGHVLHNTSKIAFKPSNSYQSLIFHHIPPNKLIPAFRILCLRTTYPFPTHPDQPLHSELSPNPSPNTLPLPDRSSQPFFYPSHTIFSI